MNLSGSFRKIPKEIILIILNNTTFQTLTLFRLTCHHYYNDTEILTNWEKGHGELYYIVDLGITNDGYCPPFKYILSNIYRGSYSDCKLKFYSDMVNIFSQHKKYYVPNDINKDIDCQMTTNFSFMSDGINLEVKYHRYSELCSNWKNRPFTDDKKCKCSNCFTDRHYCNNKNQNGQILNRHEVEEIGYAVCGGLRLGFSALLIKAKDLKHIIA
jgi:hypothetical protein